MLGRMWLSLLLVWLVSPVAAAHAQARVEVSPGAPIPTGFQTYTLFLFPSSDWLDRTSDLDIVKKAFRAFGDAIGDKHLAVWFLDYDGRQIGIERSKYFCDRLGLNYNDGPYVVSAPVHPDNLWPASRPAVIKLYDIPAPRVVNILNILEQDLRTERGIRPNPLLFEEVWLRLTNNSKLIAAILERF